MNWKKKTVLSVDEIETLFNKMKQSNQIFKDKSFLCSFEKPETLKDINIVNLLAFDNKTDIVGHWICLIPNGSDCIVYTCFGIVSYSLFKWLINYGFETITFILDQQQNLNSSSCGFYCIRFIYHFFEMPDIKAVYSYFNNYSNFDYITYSKDSKVLKSRLENFDVEKYKKIINVYMDLIKQS